MGFSTEPVKKPYAKKALTAEEQSQKLEAENKRLKEKLRNFRKENKNLLASNARLKVQVMNMGERVQKALKIF